MDHDWVSISNLSLLKVNVKGLLAFFDEKVHGSEHHATPIVAVAGEDLGLGLLIHHMESIGHTVDSLCYKCSQRKVSGPRLDAWIKVRDSSGDVLYQVEVKNSSTHAIGGKDWKLPVNVTEQELADYKIRRWDNEWNKHGFSYNGLKKVLIKMIPPVHTQLPIRPLACIWLAVHPSGKTEPLFDVKIDEPQRDFDRAWVFSMSSYLRSLNSEWIEIRMNRAVQRFKWIRELFSVCE